MKKIKSPAQKEYQARMRMCIAGIIVGIVIVFAGFSVENSYPEIGRSIKFGADFYTEIYDVTQDVGRALNSAINSLISAIGTLITAIGAIDICFFGLKLACLKAEQKKTQVNAETIEDKAETIEGETVAQPES
jgi:hypothetical protein